MHFISIYQVWSYLAYVNRAVIACLVIAAQFGVLEGSTLSNRPIDNSERLGIHPQKNEQVIDLP